MMFNKFFDYMNVTNFKHKKDFQKPYVGKDDL